MELSELKLIITKSLETNGLIKKSNSFFKESDSIIIVVGLQKKGFSDGYYINLGYFIKELHKIEKFLLKEKDADIRTRFDFGKQRDFIDISQNLDFDSIYDLIKINIFELVDFPINFGLKELLKKIPELTFQTTLRAKEYLEINK